MAEVATCEVCGQELGDVSFVVQQLLDVGTLTFRFCGRACQSFFWRCVVTRDPLCKAGRGPL